MQTRETAIKNSKPESVAPGSLTSTPVTKRSKLSSKRNRIQSPGQSKNGQSSISPYQSPLHSNISRTSSQHSGTNGESPLNNGTNYNCLQSTPNRSWLCSQEPRRDILWDDTTSPVNSRGRRGLPVGFTNIQDLCKNWTTDSHGDCLSQKHATSDKWLSIKNGLGKIPPVAKDATFMFTSNKGKHGSPMNQQKVAQTITILLESLPKNKLKGPLNFEEATTGEANDVEILAPNSDPAHKEGDGCSSDDMWGDEDKSWLLQASQYLEFLEASPSKTAVNTIPSTLSSENSTGSASLLKSGTSSAKPSQYMKAGTSKWVNALPSVIETVDETEFSSDHLCKTSNISCTNFYDKSPSARLQSNNRLQRIENKMKIVSNNQHEKRTLDVRKPHSTTVKTKIGLPGMWMSQTSTESSCSSKSDSDVTSQTLGKGTTGPSLQKREAAYTKIIPKASRQLEKVSNENKGNLDAARKLSKKVPEMPKCASGVWDSQPVEHKNDDDDSVWEGIDTILTQENMELFDKIEREAERSSQRTPKKSNSALQTQECNLSRERPKTPDVTLDSKKDNNEMEFGTSLPISSLDVSDSYKKSCSREEINRKKAEALRRRRLREEAQRKSKVK